MDNELIIGVITTIVAGIGSGVTAYFAFRNKSLELKQQHTLEIEKLKQESEQKKIENEQLRNELAISSKVLDFAGFLEEWSGIDDSIKDIFTTTNVNRILILRAWNGSTSPKWTTSVYQRRAEDQAPISYIHFELDTDYVNRLNEIFTCGNNYCSNAYYVVDEMPDSAELKNVYHNEKVNATLWCSLDRTRLSEHSTALTYISFSTTIAEKITQDEQTKCKLLVGMLKGAIHHYYAK